MKECNRCLELKQPDEFPWRNSKLGKRQNYCKDCQKLFNYSYYSRNKERHKKRISDRKKEIAKFVYDYLSENPCVVCGESDPVVLEFDHLRDKFKNVSQMIVDGHSKKSILEEIDKCQVLCSNCHKRKTAVEQGWYKEIIHGA